MTVDRTTLGAFLLMVVLAGGNAVAVNITRHELDAYWDAALRFGVSGLLFALLMIPARSPIPRGTALLGAAAYGALAFGLAFGLGGVGAALLGHVADATSIEFVFRACSLLPALGLLAAFLPHIETGGRGRRAVEATPAVDAAGSTG